MSAVAIENPGQTRAMHPSIGISDSEAAMSPFLKQWLTPSPKFDLVSREAQDRSEIERYIASSFESSYGASLAEFLPLFLTLRCSGQLSASAGVSLGTSPQAFFLEQYLDAPVESELGRLCAEAISREQIVEIGNLVSTTLGASRLMFVILASILEQAGFEWMVFTATRPLLHSLRKLGFHTQVIAQAQSARIDKNSNADWGSYYDNQPQVVAGRLSSAQELVQGRSIFTLVQRFYSDKIESLALEINQLGRTNV